MNNEQFLKALDEGKTLTNNQNVVIYKTEKGVVWCQATGFSSLAVKTPTISEVTGFLCFESFTINTAYFEVKK